GRGLGWKLLGSSLSDLAAMGRTNHRWAMIYLGAPGTTKISLLEELNRGVHEAAQHFNCALAGGDTVRAQQMSLVCAVGGDLVGSRVLERTGARAGDLLCVAGLVGDAMIGLKVLDRKLALHSKSDRAYFIKRFFTATPLFSEGEALAKDSFVTS